MLVELLERLILPSQRFVHAVGHFLVVQRQSQSSWGVLRARRIPPGLLAAGSLLLLEENPAPLSEDLVKLVLDVLVQGVRVM